MTTRARELIDQYLGEASVDQVLKKLNAPRKGDAQWDIENVPGFQVTAWEDDGSEDFFAVVNGVLVHWSNRNREWSDPTRPHASYNIPANLRKYV